MINTNPLAASAQAAAAAYEELRSYVLAGSSRGGHFGLVLLLREGVAAWIDRCAACFAPAASSAAPKRATPAHLVSQEFHAGIVSVLAQQLRTPPLTILRPIVKNSRMQG